MFEIDERLVVHVTRGDVGVIAVSIPTSEDTNYIFETGDVIRFRVFKKGCCNEIVLEKDVIVDGETEFVDIVFTSIDTKVGPLINKPVDYWYEVELNPETSPQTIIGYDRTGPKVFRLYPEGDDSE